MILSNILFYNLTSKLKLRTSTLKKEKFYIKNLLNQAIYLKKLKKNGSIRSLNKKEFISFSKKMNLKDFTVAYIISISFLKANIVIHVSDIQGKLKLFYSVGSIINLHGKRKRKRQIAISKLIFLVLKKAVFLGQKPIALHLNNVNFYKNLIISKLKRNLYIKIIKILNQIPYNGCRKKKLRRKKYIKKFK